jgi:hypothetical protein
MQPDHPIFHSFFEIHAAELPAGHNAGEPVFRGQMRTTTRARLQMIVNYNTDISQREYRPRAAAFDETNEAYKPASITSYGMTQSGAAPGAGAARCQV